MAEPQGVSWVPLVRKRAVDDLTARKRPATDKPSSAAPKRIRLQDHIPEWLVYDYKTMDKHSLKLTDLPFDVTTEEVQELCKDAVQIEHKFSHDGRLLRSTALYEKTLHSASKASARNSSLPSYRFPQLKARDLGLRSTCPHQVNVDFDPYRIPAMSPSAVCFCPGSPCNYKGDYTCLEEMNTYYVHYCNVTTGSVAEGYVTLTAPCVCAANSVADAYYGQPRKDILGSTDIPIPYCAVRRNSIFKTKIRAGKETGKRSVPTASPVRRTGGGGGGGRPGVTMEAMRRYSAQF
ncbi:hypothetical protein V5799_029303 [Amblyomma americanum]|uniref:Uncharacterized protein n=1 Tax=Amblyomma americanum TaxID=6943 RepID=A0AAQ4ERE7_AMBAM